MRFRQEPNLLKVPIQVKGQQHSIYQQADNRSKDIKDVSLKKAQ